MTKLKIYYKHHLALREHWRQNTGWVRHFKPRDYLNRKDWHAIFWCNRCHIGRLLYWIFPNYIDRILEKKDA